MAMSDFTPNKLGFDTNGFINALMRIADAYMSETSDILILLFKKEIDRNGNGAKIMKDDAKSVVREILHEVANDHITIEAGFDEEMARSMAKDFFVRVMVVIHGNQGGGRLTSKPGMSTFKKHVIGYGPSTAKTKYDLPEEFNQMDVSRGIRDNVMKDIEKYFDVMIAKISDALTPDFFSMFITGG